jgi:hypothetical protein
MKRAIRYFFPRVPLIRRLPRPPKGFSGEHCRYGEPPAELLPTLRLFIAASVARTIADAYRLYLDNPGLSPGRIIEANRRKRHREPVWHRLWRKFKEIL